METTKNITTTVRFDFCDLEKSKSFSDFVPWLDSAPKKEVMVMGAPAFKNYLASIRALISTHIDAVASLEKKITTFRGRVQDGINVVESQKKLGEHETELANTRTKIEDLKNFFVNIKKKWSKGKERVIGFVRWAPPIGVGVAPHRYTRDLCVIELYKEKFKFMIGNVLSLGALIVNLH